MVFRTPVPPPDSERRIKGLEVLKRTRKIKAPKYEASDEFQDLIRTAAPLPYCEFSGGLSELIENDVISINRSAESRARAAGRKQ